MQRQRRLSGLAGLVAMGLAAGVVGCSSNVTVAPVSASPIASSSPLAASGVSASGTSHFTVSGIAFDYPSAWIATQLDVQRHYETVLGLLGSGQFAEACPSDAQPGQFNTCVERLALPPGTVVVKVSTWHLPTPSGMSQVQSAQHSDPSAVPMKVAGQRAVLERLGEPMAGADQHWLWLIDAPGSSGTAYSIEAWLRGPDVDALRAQLDSLVEGASVRAPAP